MDNAIFIGIVQFIVLILSLSVHESAHAWSADRLGDPTARYLGRVSLNPIVHTDPMGTILLPLIGLYMGGWMFGWAKPVPVNVSKLRNPVRDHMIVAAAGPLSNMVLASGLFICLMIIKASSPEAASVVFSVAMFDVPEAGGTLLVPMTMVAFHGMILNIVLAVFNLIPVPPLDGATVLAGLLPRSMSGVFDQLQGHGFMLLIVLIVLGVPAFLYMPVIDFVYSILIGV
jgi:Zn-dependent protease